LIEIEIDEKADNKWNERLINSETATIYQTKEHAYFNYHIGRKPLFIKFIDKKGDIAAQMVGFTYSRFNEKKKFFSVFGKLLNLKEAIFNWYYGPVIFNYENIDEMCSTFGKFLVSKKYIVKGFEHPLSQKPFNHFTKPLSAQVWGTFLIDLSKDKNSLWDNLDKHSAKKNVERALKKDVFVKEITKQDLKYYQEVREETKPVSLDVLEQRWDFLHDIGWTGFLAYHNDNPVGGIMISYFNGYLNEWGIARTKNDSLKKLYAQDLLKWKIIEWGNKNNHRFYDLTGVNPNSKDDKEKGIFQYKRKWGGKLLKYNIIFS